MIAMYCMLEEQIGDWQWGIITILLVIIRFAGLLAESAKTMEAWLSEDSLVSLVDNQVLSRQLRQFVLQIGLSIKSPKKLMLQSAPRSTSTNLLRSRPQFYPQHDSPPCNGEPQQSLPT